MHSMYLKAAIACVIGLAFAGCKRPTGEPDGGVATAAKAHLPAAIRKARLLTGRVICPLEIINGNSIRESRSFPAGSKATLVGWSRVADRKQPVPPLAHLVFRSTVPDGSKDVFWPGLRVERPELAQNDPRLAQLGYSGSGTFPANPGKYKVLVWVGDSSQQRECDTGEILELR